MSKATGQMLRGQISDRAGSQVLLGRGQSPRDPEAKELARVGALTAVDALWGPASRARVPSEGRRARQEWAQTWAEVWRNRRLKLHTIQTRTHRLPLCRRSWRHLALAHTIGRADRPAFAFSAFLRPLDSKQAAFIYSCGGGHAHYTTPSTSAPTTPGFPAPCRLTRRSLLACSARPVRWPPPIQYDLQRDCSLMDWLTQLTDLC